MVRMREHDQPPSLFDQFKASISRRRPTVADAQA